MADVMSDGTAPPDAKTSRGKPAFIGGTGKYAGISGNWISVNHNDEYKASTDNTYVQLSTNDGRYNLP